MHQRPLPTNEIVQLIGGRMQLSGLLRIRNQTKFYVYKGLFQYIYFNHFLSNYQLVYFILSTFILIIGLFRSVFC